MAQIKLPTSSDLVITFFSITFSIFFNLAFWQKFTGAYPLSSANLPFIISAFITLTCIHSLLLNLIKLKYIFKPLLILLLFVSTICAYAMDSYGCIIDFNFLQNSLETDLKEIHDLLNVKLFLHLIFLTIVPSLYIIKKKFNYLQLKKSALAVIIILIVASSSIGIFSKNYLSFIRNHKMVRYYLNPIQPLYAFSKYIYNNLGNLQSKEMTQLGLDATRTINPNAKPKLIVLVVCESARSTNFNLNGYTKPTNPLLSKRAQTNHDLYSFKEVYSCGTETAVSVPCMFSHLPREQFSLNKSRNSENLLDVLQRTDIDILWRDNDSGCKQVCNRVRVDDFNDAKITGFCNDFECHDEVLLYKLQDYINSNQVRDRLIVLHKKGNHGPAYYKRYPKIFETFTPTCQTNELQECSKEEITNTYDNIIVYSDYFLNKLITMLETNQTNYDTAMLYISDHGESLGEHGVYLHAMPYFIAPKEQIHIPWIMWFSKDFKIKRQHLSLQLNNKLSHDNLFHSILGLYQIKTSLYDPKLDIFNN
jgi:lipid A ethanolaminephosphotransferase